MTVLAKIDLPAPRPMSRVAIRVAQRRRGTLTAATVSIIYSRNIYGIYIIGLSPLRYEGLHSATC